MGVSDGEKNRGFTLIELLVTIAVFAIIAMMAAPSFRTMQINQKLKLSVMEMKNRYSTRTQPSDSNT